MKVVCLLCLSLALIVTLSPFIQQTAAQCSNSCLSGLSSCVGSCRKNCSHYCGRLCKNKLKKCRGLNNPRKNCDVYSHGCAIYCYKVKCKTSICKKCRTSYGRCWNC